MVTESDVIVLGGLGCVAGEGVFPGMSDWTARYVDFTIEVERVLKDDGTVGEGRPLVQRMPDSRFGGGPYSFPGPILTPRPLEKYPPDQPGQRYLYFFERDDDSHIYGIPYHHFGRLIVDGPVVWVSDGPRAPLEVGGREVSPAAFARSRECAGGDVRGTVRGLASAA